MSLFRNQMTEEEKRGIATVKAGCPICKGDVKGNDEYLFFCAHCNILYKRDDLRVSPEHIESIMKEKIVKKLETNPLIAEKTDELKPIAEKTPQRVIEKKIYYFASKESDKVHASNCPYGKNIKAKNRIRFPSLDDAKGYTRCRCVG